MRHPLFTLAFLLSAPVASAQGFDETLRGIDLAYPKLASMRQEVASAVAKAREKRGAFDPVLLLTYDAQRYNTPSYPGKAEDFTALGGSVQIAMPSGMTYIAGSRLNGGKPKSPLNATGGLGEYYVGVKFPLLRDIGVNEKSIALRQAEFAVPLAEQNVAAFRLGVLRDAAGVYWEWSAAGERLGIARELLRLSEVRQEQIRKRFEAGDERQMSVVEAQAETERRQGAVAKAQRDLQKAAIKLGLFLGTPPGVPPPLPSPEPLAEDREARAVAQALARRPEIEAFASLRRIVELDRDLAANSRRAALDLTVTAGYDAGDRGIGPTPRIALLYSIPLRQNAADGRIADAEAKLRKLDLDRQFVVQSVSTEVADAVSAVRTALDRYRAAADEVALTRRLQTMERIAFDLGESTLFLLNQRERLAAEAEGRRVDALAEYQQAVAALRAASADL